MRSNEVEAFMNIGIMGAGSVGSYYGALLARAGHAVTLVGRPALVEAVTDRGLRLERSDFDQHITVEASTSASALADCEIVIFSVKSADTEEAGGALAPHLGADAIVLSFQNGFDNAERLSALLERAVVPVAVYVATEMVGPGHVRHHGRGEIVIGNMSGSDRIAEIFSAAGIAVTVSEQVREALWRKLTLNCAYNALSAAGQLPYGALLSVDGVAEVMTAAVMECVAVGHALGLAVDDPDLDAIFGLARSMPGQLSSTAQDIARGRPTEIDHLNGYVVRKGRALGIATPVNQTLLAVVKIQESKL